MSYKKKRYYKKKYNPQDDITAGIVIIIVIIGFKAMQIFKENPIIFYLGLAIIILVGIGILWFLKKRKEKKYLQITSIQQMKNMHWREFEKFIAFVFKKKGFKAKERKGTNDGGIDVDATKNGQRYAIHCKKWKNYKIGVVELRAFVGAVDDVGENVIGIYVTTSRLTKEARAYLERMSHKLLLWDESTLEGYVREFTLGEEFHIKESTPICTKCGSDMVLRQAQKGSHKGEQFYGCSNFPKCKNIKHI